MHDKYGSTTRSDHRVVENSETPLRRPRAIRVLNLAGEIQRSIHGDLIGASTGGSAPIYRYEGRAKVPIAQAQHQQREGPPGVGPQLPIGVKTWTEGV
jgi:hypothetical protein